jgi:hypothetical protein
MIDQDQATCEICGSCESVREILDEDKSSLRCDLCRGAGIDLEVELLYKRLRRSRSLFGESIFLG